MQIMFFSWFPQCWISAKQLADSLPLPVARDMYWTLLAFIRQISRYPHRPIQGRVQILDPDRILEGLTGPLIRGCTIQQPPPKAAAEDQHAARIGEVPVHAVMLGQAN